MGNRGAGDARKLTGGLAPISDKDVGALGRIQAEERGTGPNRRPRRRLGGREAVTVTPWTVSAVAAGRAEVGGAQQCGEAEGAGDRVGGDRGGQTPGARPPEMLRARDILSLHLSSQRFVCQAPYSRACKLLSTNMHPGAGRRRVGGHSSEEFLKSGTVEYLPRSSETVKYQVKPKPRATRLLCEREARAQPVVV